MQLARYDGNLLPFANGADPSKRYIFGGNTASDDINNNINAEFNLGWEIVGVNDAPPKQWFNALGYTSTYLSAYLYQEGIAEWNDKQEYFIGSQCKNSDGVAFISKTNNNIGNALPTTTAENPNWRLAYLSLNNTLTYTPSSDYHPATKKYVDDSELDINSLDQKTTLVNTDELVISDSEDSNILKKLSFADLKTQVISGLPSVTATATFTNSDQNINMAGIGSLEGLEIGDVIQVLDSTSNDTEYTVEFITDSDNIIVNYEHRGQTRGTPDFASKALIDETSTAGVTVKLLCKWYNASNSLGRGWCSPTSGRTTGSIYTNLTGRDYLISLAYSTSINNPIINLFIDDEEYFYNRVGTSSFTSSLQGFMLIGKDSEYNTITSSNDIWKEFR